MTTLLRILLRRFFHQHHFPATIITAVGTGLVRHFLLVAVGALRQRLRIQEVMSSSAVPPRLGMSPFGVWHKVSALFRNVEKRKNT
jgi:hypothetical protein